MKLTQFTQLLDQYGGDLQAWPATERSAATALIESSGEAHNLLNRQLEMESLLATMPAPEFPVLEARVLHQSLPARRQSVLDRCIDWLLPESGVSSHLWRPALVACLPLIVGIVVGNYFSFGVTTPDQDFQYWDDELAMLSLATVEEVQQP